VSEDRDLVLLDAFAHRFDQLVEIGDELLDRHGGLGDLAVERFAGTPLIPIDDGEALLQRRIEVTEEKHLRESWPAMQKDQRWIGQALAADHHPLIDPAQTKIADFRDAPRKHLTVGSTEGRSLSEMFHGVPSHAVYMRWR
jgi:hypothetical protein